MPLKEKFHLHFFYRKTTTKQQQTSLRAVAAVANVDKERTGPRASGSRGRLSREQIEWGLEWGPDQTLPIWFYIATGLWFFQMLG